MFRGSFKWNPSRDLKQAARRAPTLESPPESKTFASLLSCALPEQQEASYGLSGGLVMKVERTMSAPSDMNRLGASVFRVRFHLQKRRCVSFSEEILPLDDDTLKKRLNYEMVSMTTASHAF